MPANLTPPYHDAEERFKAATTHEERLEAMREMIALLPKHKGTEKLYADLKKRLAKLETEVERGASRAAGEQGFVERIHQGGQTGTSVGPKLYVALGISGAIQHMIGVANSETIVAINSDPNSPIFKQCDYYMIGTVEDIIPKLVEALHEA